MGSQRLAVSKSAKFCVMFSSGLNGIVHQFIVEPHTTFFQTGIVVCCKRELPFDRSIPVPVPIRPYVPPERLNGIKVVISYHHITVDGVGPDLSDPDIQSEKIAAGRSLTCRHIEISPVYLKAKSTAIPYRISHSRNGCRSSLTLHKSGLYYSVPMPSSARKQTSTSCYEPSFDVTS